MANFNRKLRYMMFLKSKEWQDLRQVVKQRARKNQGRCERCGQWCLWMVVHHITYRFGWLCDPKWLAYICTGCHEYIHYRSDFDPKKETT